MESNIIIYKPDDNQLANITFDTDSYRRWEVMGENSITLNFSLPQIPNGITEAFLEIPIGSYVNFKGRRYTLYNPTDFTKNGTRNYEYTLKLYAYQELLYDAIFINEPDGMQVFPLTARPEQYLQYIVRNMNKFDVGDWDGVEWTIGDCISSNVQQTVQFNGVSVMEALKLVAEAFKTEWEINNKVISLKKVEYNRQAPLILSYGKGNGFVPGLGRFNYDESRPVNKLYVKGGNRNISNYTYGAQNLLLPKAATIRFDGTYFEDEAGYNSAIARQYQTSADGTYLTRIGVAQTSRREAFIELNEAYPKFVGTITDIIWSYNGTEYTTYQQAADAALADTSNVNGIGAVFCDVIDTNIPDGLNFADMRIGGEQMVLTPQTGRLSGRDLEILQGQEDASDGYIHAQRRFKLITQSDYNDMFIPDNRLSVGDTYAIFGIDFYKATTGQQVYISNGERDLLKEAVRYKYENEDLRFTFKGELDGIYAQSRWDEIEDKIVAGGYVQFSDPQFHPNGVLIRMSAIKEYLHEPYKPELELTNVVHGGGLKGELAEIPQQEIVIDGAKRDIQRINQRRWQDTMELRNELGNVFTEFSEAVNPVSVQTMQLIAGSERGQFRFVTSRTSLTEVTPIINYSRLSNNVRITGYAGGPAYIQHLTLGLNIVDGKSVYGNNNTIIRPASEYRSWSIPAYTSPAMQKDKLYWVYAKVLKSGTTGVFYVSEASAENIPYDDGTNYNLIIGALNSENEGTRSWAPLYGFTEILPGMITTPMLRSNDGRTYFDLINGIIGGRITFIGSDNQPVNMADFADWTTQDIEDLTEQIAGKVETWYQATDPSYNWTTTALKQQHTGDIWYNTTTKEILRYGGYAWSTFEETGNKTFAQTPVPPYKIGDIWVNGAGSTSSENAFYRCVVARASGNYVASDWVRQTEYDSTQVVIDNGMISAGRVEVGNGLLGTGLAGITGQGQSATSIRMWAGNNWANRAVAPFRVNQAGEVWATNAHIAGEIDATSGEIGGFVIDSTHIGDNGSDSSLGMSLFNNSISFGTGNPIIFSSFGSASSLRPALYIKGDSPSVPDSLGLGLVRLSSNQYDRPAITVQSGTFQGFRMPVVRSSSTASEFILGNTTIYYSLDNATLKNLYLPPANVLQIGCMIYIRASKTGQVRVYTQDSVLIDDGAGANVQSLIVGGATGEMGVFMYDGVIWKYNYMGRAAN